MNTDTLAIIPVRSLSAGKTRLAPAVSPEMRKELTKRMLAVTMAACKHSEVIDQILVISPDVEALSFAHSIDHEVLNVRQDDHPGGLIPALDQARSVGIVNQFATMIILFADLPLVNGDDVARLASAPGSIALAPDQADQGTNGLLLRRTGIDPLAFRLQFGADSFPAHLAESLRLGITPDIVRTPGLGFDLDTPEDLGSLISLDFPDRWTSLEPAS